MRGAINFCLFWGCVTKKSLGTAALVCYYIYFSTQNTYLFDKLIGMIKISKYTKLDGKLFHKMTENIPFKQPYIFRVL